MPSVNTVELSGMMLADPDEIKTRNGTPMAKCRLSFYAGGSKDTTKYGVVEVVAFDEPAKFLLNECEKGMNIIVTGRMTYDSWEQDGKKRDKITITAREIQVSEFQRHRSASHDAEPSEEGVPEGLSESLSRSLKRFRDKKQEEDDVPF